MLTRNLREASVTLVLPCLNEAASLPALLESCRAAFEADTRRTWAILVVDNGSTDTTREIAKDGAGEVILCGTRGYGAALRQGLSHVSSPWAVYADGDATYDARDFVNVAEELERTKADLVVGSRLRGTIEPGAMPVLHRLFGTPFLNRLLKIFHGIQISDSNSGLRGVQMASFKKWNLRATGMEFASEIFVEASRQKAVIREIPISYRRNPLRKDSHLRPLSDGWRHIRLILGFFKNR